MIKGLKRLSTPLPKSNHCIKREEITYLFFKSLLTGQNFFVFYEGTTAAGIHLNDEKFGMLYGNHVSSYVLEINKMTTNNKSR